VNVLAVSDGTVYAAGVFSYIGGQLRNRLAALDATTGAATAWNPNPNSYSFVKALAVSGGTVYAGGRFSSIGGQSRYCLAELDASTGVATAWNPNVIGNGSVDALAVSGETIYVGGNFWSVGGQGRLCLGAVNATSGMVTSWSADISATQYQPDIYALAVSGGTIYVGGNFTNISGQPQSYFARFDTTSGAQNWLDYR
jgi:hypothetical protein